MVPKLVVDPEGLSASATKVRGHSDDLDVGHATTDTRVSAASGGWAGESSQALTAWVAKLRTGMLLGCLAVALTIALGAAVFLIGKAIGL